MALAYDQLGLAPEDVRIAKPVEGIAFTKNHEIAQARQAVG